MFDWQNYLTMGWIYLIFSVGLLYALYRYFTKKENQHTYINFEEEEHAPFGLADDEPDVPVRYHRKPSAATLKHNHIDKANLDPNPKAKKGHYFYGKKIVFTGVIDNMSRNYAAKRLADVGADINTAISQKTDFVIVGAKPGPRKMEKIAEMQANGHHIVILDEDEFLEKLES